MRATRSLALAVALLLVAVAPVARAATDADTDGLSPRALENMVAFTRLLGLVRYFHPSDEAAKVDWDAFAVAAIDTVERAATPGELAGTLRALFLPAAPTLRIDTRPVDVNAASLLPQGAQATQIVEWRHRGFGGSALSNETFKSERVHTPTAQRSKGARPVGTAWTGNLGGGVWCAMPMVLWADKSGTLPRASLPPRKSKHGDWNKAPRAVRLADVALFWNVPQHFHPYLGLAGDWNLALRTALRRAATDPDPETFRATLERMVGVLHDGQGWVGGHDDRYVLPLAWTFVGDSLVVRAVAENREDPAVGDIVVTIDGEPTGDVAARIRERVSAATSVASDYLVARKMCFSPTPSTIDIEVVGHRWMKRHANVDFGDPRRLASMKPPEIPAEPAPGVAYVDLASLADSDVPAELQRLASAKAIVFDVRVLPTGAAFALLPHLSDKPLKMPRLGVPVIYDPDRENIVFDEKITTVAPEAPFLSARKVFVTGPGGLSPGETFMGTIEQGHVGDIVGAPTGGTNGAVARVDLPGGYSVRFTGTRVQKPDGTRNQTVGVKPTIPVHRTVAGIREGRDEVLDKAIEVAKRPPAAAKAAAAK